jgi:hypothetical protein
MLNLQQTKLLSALLSSSGITDNFDYSVEGYQYSLTFEVIEEIEAITDLRIEQDRILVEAEDGTVEITQVYKLNDIDIDHAQSIFNNQIDTFHKNGISVSFLK